MVSAGQACVTATTIQCDVGERGGESQRTAAGEPRGRSLPPFLARGASDDSLPQALQGHTSPRMRARTQRSAASVRMRGAVAEGQVDGGGGDGGGQAAGEGGGTSPGPGSGAVNEVDALLQQVQGLEATVEVGSAPGAVEQPPGLMDLPVQGGAMAVRRLQQGMGSDSSSDDGSEELPMPGVSRHVIVSHRRLVLARAGRFPWQLGTRIARCTRGSPAIAFKHARFGAVTGRI